VTQTAAGREPQPARDMVAVEQSRAVTEIQSQIEVAIKFPRDEERARSKLLKACQRRSFAERALYAYQRGGGLVTGPAIGMAKEAARLWGNIRYGWVELQRRDGESIVQAFAHDLETNTQDTRVFTVRHVRDTRQGQKVLTEERDIYEMNANQAARRMRQCIFELLPADVLEDAIAEVNKTMAGDGTESLEERVAKVVERLGEFGVAREQIEAKLGHNLDATTERELVTLRAAGRNIEDGFVRAEQLFGDGEPTTEEGGDVAAGEARQEQQSKPRAAKPDAEDLIARIELSDNENEIGKLVIEASQLSSSDLARAKKAAEARKKKLKAA